MVRRTRRPNSWKTPQNPELADPGAALFRRAKAEARANRQAERERRRRENTRKARDAADWQKIRAVVIAHYGQCPCGATVNLRARLRRGGQWNSGRPEDYEVVCATCFMERPPAADELTEEFRQMFG